ncbi:MAG: amylo-alpha-1,6-glucosidase [Candidatus Woesearchaeota archaeon]
MTPEELLERCGSPYGFLASANNHNNYKRVWSRDASICIIASLKTENKKLHTLSRKSLQTLLKHQHEYGFLPSNVGESSTSYGSATGRVDSNLWVIIALCSYYEKKQKKIPKYIVQKIQKILKVLHAWEFNGKHLIYIPQGGDWADEYIHSGYILYDQLLYYHTLVCLQKQGLYTNTEKIEQLKKTIRHTFFPNEQSTYRYSQKIPTKEQLITAFEPGSIQCRFDGFAYSLALLLDVFPAKIKKQILCDAKKFEKDNLIPAFGPVILPTDPEYVQLQQNVGFEFKNTPHNYHNGGVWPLINGFYVAAKKELSDSSAEKTYTALKELNAKDDYSYTEWFNAETLQPKGMKHQAWSAAAQIIAKRGFD